MTMFGHLSVPDDLLNEEYALDLLRRYFNRDADGYVYSGAVFDTYPSDPASGAVVPSNAANVITDSDLIALSLLGIHVTGYEAMAIRIILAQEIEYLLNRIPAHSRIEEEGSITLLAPDGPAWDLWVLLHNIKDRTKDARFGAVAAGKLLARKRPGLIPIEDHLISSCFMRKAPAYDVKWWDDVRSAALDGRPLANGTTLWRYLARLRSAASAEHLPILRVLDIIGWMHARRSGPIADT